MLTLFNNKNITTCWSGHKHTHT